MRLSATAILLALAVLSPLFSPSPAQAFDIGIFCPSTGLLESYYNFVVTATVGSNEQMVINSVDVSVYYASERSRFEDYMRGLPITTSTRNYAPEIQFGPYRPPTTVLASGKNRSYVYYNISWMPPPDWPMGKYRVQVTVTTSSNVYIETSEPFVLYLQGPPAPRRPNDIYNYMVQGSDNISRTIAIQSPDGNLNITIFAGTKCLTSARQAVAEISIVGVTSPPPPPAGSTIVGVAYDLGPSKATFSPPITLNFYYSPSRIPTGFTEHNLVPYYYDMTRDQWVMLEGSVVDPASYSVNVQLGHFTSVALMTYRFPASFSGSLLSIAPAPVTSGESTKVTATITNRGDLRGSYEVVLIVDDDRYATTKLTLDGKASENVTFEVKKTAPGLHKVQLAGLSGTFTVVRPPPPPPPPAPTSAPAPTLSPSPKPKPKPSGEPSLTPIPLPPPPPSVPGWVVVAGFVAIMVMTLAIWWLFRGRRIS